MPFFSNFPGRSSISKFPPFAKPTSPIPLYSKHLPLKTVNSTRPKLSLETLSSFKMSSGKMSSCKKTRWMPNDIRGILHHIVITLPLFILVPIIGFMSTLVSQLNAASSPVPSLLNATFAFACLALVYVFIRWILLIRNKKIWVCFYFFPDLCFFGVFLLLTILPHKPMAAMKCTSLPKHGGNTANFIHSFYANASQATGDNFEWLVDPSQELCRQIQAIWGLSWAAFFWFLVYMVVDWIYVSRGEGCKEPQREQVQVA
ncbi:hypothetical protein TrVFT333_003705 [Trichoderma virens FT-333]|nr:hypothetical protein TrVFT333_003705 [Trichoderma virens FT-333]